jgi:hypothetical protein
MQALGTKQSTAPGRNTVLAWILGIHLASHVMWLTLPSIIDLDDIGATQYIVNSTTLTVGLVAVFAMWKGFRWGRWTMIVLTVLLSLLTVPEMFFLTGVARVASIIAATGIVATMVLLFRPPLRGQG